jgi:hypothetical protein
MQQVWILAIIMLLALAPGLGLAQSAAPTQTQPAVGKPEKGQATKAVDPAARQKYQKKIAADLAGYQQKLGEFKTQVSERPVNLQRMYIRSMVLLQKRTYIAEENLKKLEAAPDSQWTGLKDDMDKEMADLAKSFGEFQALLQKN